MESIVSKTHVELGELAATYADAGYENVTLSLIIDFQRALFPILDESIRVKDLEQSEELRDEIVQLFKDEYPTKPAWPYLNQLDKQDKCFAKLGCRFKHGAALYKSPLCEEHFVCKDHQLSPCLAKHEHIPGQEQRAKDDTKNSSKRRLVGGDRGQEISGDNKLDKTNAGKGQSAKDAQYTWVDNSSYDRGSSSSDESEWDDDVVNREGMNRQNADVGR
jgi:hypothetical protein